MFEVGPGSFSAAKEALAASTTTARNTRSGTLAATVTETVKEDCGAEFAMHGGKEGAEDSVLRSASGCKF